MRRAGIYGIKNLTNSKWYVGQSTNVDGRIKHHIYNLKKGTHSNAHLQSSFNSDGLSSFEFHILEITLVLPLLDIKEQTWINHYHSDDPKHGYNLDSGGSLNKKHSEETKKLIGELNSWTVPSVRTRQKQSNAKLGKSSNRLGCKHTRESKLKMSRAHQGIQHSQESCNQISITLQGHTVSAVTRRKISKTRRRKFSLGLLSGTGRTVGS